MPDVLGFTEVVLHAITNPVLPASGAFALLRFQTARSVRLVVAACAAIAFAVEVAIAEDRSGLVGAFLAWAVAAAFWTESLLHVAWPILAGCRAAFCRGADAVGRWISGK